MSVQYKPVIWNRNKLVYDAILIAAVAVYILTFVRLAPMLQPNGTAVTGDILRMHAFGTCAFLMLTFILCIGPLARIDERWLPVLYNRRHFGVLTAFVALIHASYVMGWYYAFSAVDPYVALLTSNTSFAQLAGFPFELFGVLALAILVVLAVTSHDFWLAFLGPRLWKSLHMLVYVAYAAIVVHVALGALQSSMNAGLALVVSASIVAVSGLHVWAGMQTGKQARVAAKATGDRQMVDAGSAEGIAEGRARIVQLADGSSVAIFRHENNLFALENRCAHQGGPLGEGCIVDGLVTCPWHGYQYRPRDGRSPPPFTEKVKTYRLALEDGRVLLDPHPNPPGTASGPVPMARAEEART